MSAKEPEVGQDTDTNINSGKEGRPFKFTSVAQMQAKIDSYFAECDPHPVMVTVYEWYEIEEKYETKEKGKTVQKTHMVKDYSRLPKKIERYDISPREPYSITGLALALDTSRRTLLDYEDNVYDDDSLTPDEKLLFTGLTHAIKKAKRKIEHDVQRRLETNAVVGTIFNLKNNFGWIDRSEQDGTQEIVITTRKHANSKT